MLKNDKWWQRAVIYQIYPRSFCDGNGDGIGDLRGITGKVGYLRSLGVDAVWLSPIYLSPGVDNGYDISDYCAIDPVFGTMADFDELVSAFHNNGIKLIMDFVINHTSVEHEWFRKSRRSTDNPYRDYYIWRKGKNGGAPCNWTSVFGGSAWTKDEITGEYYFHLFTEAQPDLNWENPDVRKAIVEVGKFWAEKGVDGLRIDCANFLAKNCDFEDITENFDENLRKKFINYGPIHEYFRYLNEQLFSEYGLATIGECSRTDPNEAAMFVSPDRRELDLIFQFEHMSLEEGEHGKWNRASAPPERLIESLVKWQTSMAGRGWNSLYFDNHDQPRMVSRFGDDGKYRAESAKMLAVILMTLQGTPFIYQGTELSMRNISLKRDEMNDCEAENFLAENDVCGYYPPEEAVAIVNLKGRDNARTPMQWNGGTGAGFTVGKPWLKINPDYSDINAEAMIKDKSSVWNFYRELIAFRRSHEEVFIDGVFSRLGSPAGTFVYTRTGRDETMCVTANLTARTIETEIGHCLRPEMFNYAEPPLTGNGKALLRPYESAVWKVVDV